MKKLICCPAEKIPKVIPDDIGYVSLCESSGSKERGKGVGHIAVNLKREIRRAGLKPSNLEWDFTMIALSIAAADESFQRNKSFDGWTRQIVLDVYLHDPSPWNKVKKSIEKTAHFLTGDFWELNFLDDGMAAPNINENKINNYDADCVSLLSGGVDSLVGAIDIVSDQRKPIFVSKVATGDKDKQKQIAKALCASESHLQWSCAIRKPYNREGSTRGRSIIFLAYAVLATSAIKTTDYVSIIVPENGFISLNIPLNPSRLGTLSTKTTHPIYMSGLESIWNEVGLKIRLERPYSFCTKGEMLLNCKNQKLLKKLIGNTTSCGRFGTYKRTHCGRCVPCMVRRAAFIKANLKDLTLPSKGYRRAYVFENLKDAGKKSGSNDVGAVAGACLEVEEYGVNHFIGGALSFSDSKDRDGYREVFERGLLELRQLLESESVI